MPLVHKNFTKLLKVGENKTALFNLIAAPISNLQSSQLLVSTKEDNIVSNLEFTSNSSLQPCNQEEADTSMFLHVLDASTAGNNKVMLLSSPSPHFNILI